MKALLIDPDRRSITVVDVPNDDAAAREEMRRLIGADKLDWSQLSNLNDTIWTDEFSLRRGEPIAAFKLAIQHDPYAGRAIVTGADQRGRTAPPSLEIVSAVRQDIQWLGRILPEVTDVAEANGMRSVVIYTRCS